MTCLGALVTPDRDALATARGRDLAYHRLVQFLTSWAHTMKRRDALRTLLWAATAASVGHSLDLDEHARVAAVLSNPGRVDAQTIEHIKAVLWRCERQDDTLPEEIEGRVGVVDGSLCPCWSWAEVPELYSGKHKTTGHAHQFVCDLSGNLMHISEPLPGNTHDAKAMHQTGLNELLGDDNVIGDKGYIGTGITTRTANQPEESSSTGNQPGRLTPTTSLYRTRGGSKWSLVGSGRTV